MNSRAAIPDYVQKVAGRFEQSAPGHRFSLYCPIWNHEWKVDNAAKLSALKCCTGEFSSSVKSLLNGIRERQHSVAEGFSEALFQPAVSTSAFVTGLGNEHPVENGFAFLSPYGLPYLPGSSVKGVMRRAAEEMAVLPGPQDTSPADLDLLDIWWLFGFEGESGLLDRVGSHLEVRTALDRLAHSDSLTEFIRRVHPPQDQASANEFISRLREESFRRTLSFRGALTFLDVFPAPRHDRLSVDIMTPHFAHYYQKAQTPHDAGQPVPIPFLVVPAGSQFDFHVACDSGRLPLELGTEWTSILATVFTHAFEWLGFGAKTAAGYGQMELDAKRLAQRKEEIADRRERTKRAEMSDEERVLDDFEKFLERERANRPWPANGLVANERVILLRVARDWTSGPIRHRAAELIESTVKDLPWSKKTRTARQEALARLR